jgi:hypothetical protein
MIFCVWEFSLFMCQDLHDERYLFKIFVGVVFLLVNFKIICVLHRHPCSVLVFLYKLYLMAVYSIGEVLEPFCIMYEVSLLV